MKSKTISTNELRFNFDKVLLAMKRGTTLTLTYRQKPLARIEPILEEGTGAFEEDPFFELLFAAEPLGRLENEEIDNLIYRL